MTILVTGQTGTRDRILDAAERLLGRFGYRKMTVEDIAVEARIGNGTVYLSFWVESGPPHSQGYRPPRASAPISLTTLVFCYAEAQGQVSYGVL